MELPDDILYIIRDYSRSLTRPDWRSLHRMPSYRFHLDVAQSLNRSSAQSLFELTNRDASPEYRYHVEFYGALPYVVFIYGPDMTPMYIPY
jgi:hypothetical protein